MVDKQILRGTLQPNSVLQAHLAAGMNTPVLRVANKYDLPTVGDENKIYVAVDENAIYRWDDKALLYYCIGRDYNDIKFINGGNLDEQ